MRTNIRSSTVTIALTRMGHAYSIMRQALDLLGWSKYYDQISLNSDDIRELNDTTEYLLCVVVRGILFDSIPELYQTLK